jgi:DNA-binding transcriptional MerR regulator
MSEPQLRIGPFSRASSLSIKALRAYHEQGLLVPAAVDPETGYRNYAASQLLDAAVLRRLRDLDVPLRQVREVLEARDPSVTERILAEHARRMQARLDQTVRIIEELQRGVDAPALHTPVHVRVEPARHVLMRDGQGIEGVSFGAFLDESFALLTAVASRVGADTVDVPGAVFRAEIADDAGEDMVAFVVLAEPVAIPPHAPARLGELPATRVAVATHFGSYDAMAETYRQLGRWVAEHERPRSLDIRERYVVRPPADEASLCSEIHWPVE